MKNPIKATPRTILVTGATGFIGQCVCRALLTEGDHLIVLTRNPSKARKQFDRSIRILTSLDQIQSTEHIDAVINLAGAPIAGWLWTPRRRRTLLESRILTTQAIVDLIQRLEHKPNVLVSASAIGYYGIHGEKRLIESDKAGTIFQSTLCSSWEETALQAEQFGTRVCLLRLGLVLGRTGGVLPKLMMPLNFRFHIIFGSGNQWVSWIHIEDVTRLVSFAIETDALHGPVNGTTQRPVHHEDLILDLAKRRHSLFGIKIPAAIFRAALGELSQLFVDGQKVVPLSAPALGFKFRFEKLNRALDDLVSRKTRRSAIELFRASTIFRRQRRPE